MKKTILKSALVAFFATISLSACSNDNEVMNAAQNLDKNTIVSKPPPIGLVGLFYKEGGASSMSTVSNAFAKTTSKTIFGINSADVIEINLTSLAVGTYTISPYTYNKFYYKKPGTTNTWVALTGTITITSTLSNTLTGTFNMTSGTGIPSVNSVSGYFESIPRE